MTGDPAGTRGIRAMAMEEYGMEPAEAGPRETEAALRRLADVALLPGSLTSPQERSILDSVLAYAVTRLDATMRLRLAERLAPQADAPRELALVLALDDIEIATPLLTEGLPLKDGDLIQIARDGTDEHRLLIAARKELSSAVADMLIEAGDTRLIETLLANRTADLSYRAIETLVRRSAAEPEFQAPLLARPELSVRLAQLMFWWVPPAMRLEILNRFTVERRHIHSAMEDMLDGRLADTALDIALSVVRRPRTFDKRRLAHMLGNGPAARAEELAADLAAEANIRPETMFRILKDHGGEPLSVFAKAVGMNRKEFGDLIVAAVDMRKGVGLPAKADLERIGELFDTISTDRADLALHCWDTGLANEVQANGGAGD
ncbi:MAG: DUF2336 domain-containing protein [Parvibaculum sp.]|uniref:DUF2336 domain-containing protein n=1 Tax=Parvibaculum sp. TaxID=2024848 RepID=UPI0032EE27AD